MVDEYQKVAAIVCNDMKVLGALTERQDVDEDFLRKSILMMVEKMEEAINNPRIRDMRYSAMCALALVVRDKE